MRIRGEPALRWRVIAALAVLVIPIMLLVVPLDRLARWLGRPGRRPARAPSDENAAIWVDQFMHRLSGPWHHTCLRRSAVLYHLLRRAGREVELVVGVRRDEQGALAAHAWLASNETPYLERGTEHPHDFSVIARFPELASRPG